jgi:hypothetical protein
MTPQYLVARGQSGSYLDYEIDAKVGALICADRGHFWGGGDEDRVYRFCTTCGIRQHKETGEETKLFRPDWEFEHRECEDVSQHGKGGHVWSQVMGEITQGNYKTEQFERKRFWCPL